MVKGGLRWLCGPRVTGGSPEPNFKQLWPICLENSSPLTPGYPGPPSWTFLRTRVRCPACSSMPRSRPCSGRQSGGCSGTAAWAASDGVQGESNFGSQIEGPSFDSSLRVWAPQRRPRQRHGSALGLLDKSGCELRFLERLGIVSAYDAPSVRFKEDRCPQSESAGHGSGL